MPISATELLGIVAIRGADEGVIKLLAVGGAADSAGAKLAGLAVGGPVLASAGLIALGAAAVKMDADLQQGINRLKTGGGDIQDTFASLRSGIQSVALMSGILTGPLTQAMYLIVSSGQRGAQAFATEAAAAQGAQIEQAKVADVTKVLTTLQTNWGLSTYTAAQYMDGLISVVSHGKITLEDLSTAMSPILPIAAEFGISFRDIASAMSVQTNAGLDAARAATGLQAVMVNLENPTAKATKAMKEFGVNGTAVANEMKVSLPGAFQMLIDAALKVGPVGSVAFNQAMADMVGGGTRTTKTIDALDQNMKAWLGDIADVNKAMGNTSTNVAGWDTAQSNLNVQLERGQAFLQVMGQNIGDVLLPYVSSLLAFVLPLGEGFATWATSTDGLAGKINQLAAFISYLYQDIQANGALKEFGAVLGDIGQTVSNVVNTGLLILGTIFGTTASQAGKATDAAHNVAGGLLAIANAAKDVSGFLSMVSGWFADAGLKGEILRGVLIGIGVAFAGMKIATVIQGIIGTIQFFQLLIPVLWQTQGAAIATSTAFAGMGLALIPIAGIATGAALALNKIHSVMADPMPSGNNTLWGQIQGISVGGLWNAIQQNSQQTAQRLATDFNNMYHNATTSTQQMSSGVTLYLNNLKNGAIETTGSMDDYVKQKMADMGSGSAAYVRNMRDQVVNDWFNMHQQVYSETSALSSQAMSLINRLHDSVIGDFASMDAQAIGYWNDVAAYIAGHPIDGNITYTTQNIGGGGATSHHFAEGTNYAPGGWSWVGERGPELAYIPRGAQIIPHTQSVGGGSGGGSPVQINVNIAGHNVARFLLPDIVTAIRNGVGTVGI